LEEAISKLPNYTPNVDIKTLQPIELFFSRKVGKNVVLIETIADPNREYLESWFKEGVSL